MGGCRCVFRKCPVGTSQYPGMHFFTFPFNNKERYKRWLTFADTMHFLKMPASFQKNRVVCARHFRDECFKNYKRDRLNPGAEPTLFRLNDELVLDYAQVSVTESEELQKKPKRSRNETISTELQSQPKKIKILNSTATSSAVESATSSSIIQIELNDGHTMLSIPLDSGEYIQAKDMVEDNDDEDEEFDLGSFEEYINGEMSEKEDVAEYVQNAEQVDNVTDELLARINKLENELKESKEALKCKTTELAQTEMELNKVKSELDSLSENHEELCKDYKKMVETNKNSCKQIQKLQQDKSKLENKCSKLENQRQNKQMDAVSTSQAPTPLTNNEICTSNSRQYAPPSTNPPLTVTKAQLFNGIRKYTSSSMLALLRMEMFGGADREWKPDERRVAMDLLQLGDEVYKYINDEWRFRLPALSEVRKWLADVTNGNEDDEDL
ncbi:putative leucine-rich repeat-containing protein DDB_G0290503 isoform X3 [Ceratitis capitata]|uniref:putative leucine-rich repeat-containing protein DDB_G0290503 isoform X3 n=1 Tax=Ceratitis capitata TaxID=7213 RepID=UPI000A10E6D2|nr:putative leucine-rich repeat-containing protein DDB_G0290503 isoform X3 [Ceratitis capitata]